MSNRKDKRIRDRRSRGFLRASFDLRLKSSVDSRRFLVFSTYQRVCMLFVINLPPSANMVAIGGTWGIQRVNT